jgi:hypothetical protein
MTIIQLEAHRSETVIVEEVFVRRIQILIGLCEPDHVNLIKRGECSSELAENRVNPFI